MKELHLLCNAHLDPIWMWDWDEGAAAAIATYYSASELLDESEFVFCHNESLLYEFIEKYDPALFERIQRQVAQGKWSIMGGWYVQPDCHAPSGESIVRQIYIGGKYFKEKFGKTSKVGVNFDSFGHSRGLVQILAKSGYEGYLFCRPMPEWYELEDFLFTWVGYDGSTIKAMRLEGETIYCTPFGQAKENIKQRLPKHESKEISLIPWGIGNHGGGPSRKDLKDLETLGEEIGCNVIHSTPEAFFEKVTPSVTFDKQLDRCFVKCYSSLHNVKKRFVELENALYFTEKIASVAHVEKGLPYDEKAFEEAMKQLCFMQFHDVLSGTCTKEGERTAIRKADYAMELLEEIKAKAFFKLAEDYPKAKGGTYPIYAFNPYPYAKKTIVEAEFLALDSICTDDIGYTVHVSANGKPVKSQVIKESSNINYDRRKRLAIEYELPPMSVTHFDVELTIDPKAPKAFAEGDKLVFEDATKKVTIDTKTGLICAYEVDGKDLLNGDLFQPWVYDDNADPWGWAMFALGENGRKLSLAGENSELFGSLKRCHIVEDGELLTRVESLFEGEGIAIRVDYMIYKNLPYVDVKFDVSYGTFLKALRVNLPVDGKVEVQEMFGRETLVRDGLEKPMQRFVHFENGLTIANDGVFSCMATEEGVQLTLLNGSSYVAHRIGDRPLIDTTRYVGSIEHGNHTFRFRVGKLAYGTEENFACEFNQAPYALNMYPHGEGKKESLAWSFDERLSLVSMRKVGEKQVIRLINNSENAFATEITFFGKTTALTFGKFEVKTLAFENGEIIELAEML